MSTHWKPYPEYKDSGVEWLGRVPTHWAVKRLKLVTELNPLASEVTGRPPDLEVSFVPMEAIGEYGGIDLSQTKRLSDVTSGYTYFRNGDVIVAKITPCFENGKGAHANDLTNGIAFGTTELAVLRVTRSLDERFLFYSTLTDAFRKLGEGEMYGAGGQKRVPDSFIKDLRHPLPPISEQQAIAKFIDHEAARIVALTDKNTQLVDLLAKKRSGLINRTIVRGLDKSTKLVRTSSLAFPEIHTGWRLRKLRHLLNRVRRPIVVDPETEYQEIGIRSWGKGIFHKDPLKGALFEEKGLFQLEPGDLVFNIVFAWEGAVAVVSDQEAGMVASHRFPTFRPSIDLNLDYLLMVLQSEPGRGLMAVNSPGAAGRNRTIRINQFLDEEIPLPPIDEQREIVAAFRREERRIDEMLVKVEHAIDVLRERRVALISAAVMGKIDVRENPA